MAWQSFRLTGYVPDLPPDAVPPEYWTSVANVRFRDGVAERWVGANTSAITGTALTRYQAMWPGRSNLSESVIYAGNDLAGPRARVAVYTVGAGHTDITPGGWAATATSTVNPWTGGPFSNGVLVNDIRHQPIWVDVGGLTATVLTATYKFGALRPYKYQAIGISEQTSSATYQTVRWSASATPGAAPTTWAPAAGNDAGSADITSQSAGVLIDGGQLGEDFVIYGENSSHLMTYVGGATVHTIRRLSSNTGILSRNCWADIGGAHVVLTMDDVILVTTRGVEKSLLDGRLRRTLFSGLYNTDQRHKASQVWYDRRRGLVYVALTNGLSQPYLSQAFVWEVATDTWGKVDLYGFADQVACAAMLGTDYTNNSQPKLVIGSSGAGVSLAQSVALQAETTNSGHYTSQFLRDDLDFGDAARTKFIKGLRLRGSAATAVSVKVRIGTKMAQDEAYTYTSFQTVALASTQYVPFTCQGRWVSVDIQDVATGAEAYRIEGFDIEYVPGGMW